RMYVRWLDKWARRSGAGKAPGRPEGEGHTCAGVCRGLVVDAEAAVPRARHQPRELRLADVNERRVIAAFEIDVGLLLDAVVDDDVEIVAFADGGNRAELAVRKQPLDLAFVGQSDVIARLLPPIRQAAVVRRRQARQPVSAGAAQDDSLGEAITGDVAGLGGARGRHRGVVREHLVGDVLVEMLLQCRGERHGYPPSMEMRWRARTREGPGCRPTIT